MIGLTPPPAKYFSYTPFLASKVYPDGTTASVCHAWETPSITPRSEPSGRTPFNAPVALIFTPDRERTPASGRRCRRAGYPAGIINTLVFPASMLNLGHGETADELRIRSARGDLAGPGRRRRLHERSAAQCFPRDATQPGEPRIHSPRHALRIRGTGQTEMYLMNKLNQLREGIIAANPGHGCHRCPVPQPFTRAMTTSSAALTRGETAGIAFTSVPAMCPKWARTTRSRLEDGEFLVIYGPNHVATGKATYMNVNVYASETAKLTHRHP